jgi:enoyl-CoA hydratase/carnithine racemase
MREDLLAALKTAEGRAVVITGAGRAFSAGGDVENMARLQKAGDVDAFRKLLDAGRDVVIQIAEMPQPVIASVNGIAAGAGCNLALACDYRIASEEAKLGETFVRIGIHPDWGGTWTLPRLVGTSRALEIMMTGRMVDAAEALAIGMVDRVVPAAELAAETEKLARAIAGGPPIAIAGIKRALAASRTNGLREQIDLESEHQLRAFASSDAAEGITAFIEKRAPRW